MIKFLLVILVLVGSFKNVSAEIVDQIILKGNKGVPMKLS